jgi:hypothetical protein
MPDSDGKPSTLTDATASTAGAAPAWARSQSAELSGRRLPTATRVARSASAGGGAPPPPPPPSPLTLLAGLLLQRLSSGGESGDSGGAHASHADAGSDGTSLDALDSEQRGCSSGATGPAAHGGPPRAASISATAPTSAASKLTPPSAADQKRCTLGDSGWPASCTLPWRRGVKACAPPATNAAHSAAAAVRPAGALAAPCSSAFGQGSGAEPCLACGVPSQGSRRGRA